MKNAVLRLLWSLREPGRASLGYSYSGWVQMVASLSLIQDPWRGGQGQEERLWRIELTWYILFCAHLRLALYCTEICGPIIEAGYSWKSYASSSSIIRVKLILWYCKGSRHTLYKYPRPVGISVLCVWLFKQHVCMYLCMHTSRQLVGKWVKDLYPISLSLKYRMLKLP